MPDRIYIASNVSIVAVTGTNIGVPLGVVENVRLEKSWVVEGVPEIGNFRFADILTHGLSARFSWGQAYTAGGDLAGRGLVPRDVGIPEFLPILLRLIDQRAQREIALVHRGVIETFSIDTNARAKLMSNISGLCISLLLESELN